MARKISLRHAVIMGVATGAGSAAGSVAEAGAELMGQPLPGIGPLVTGVFVLWCAEKLDRVIADDQEKN
ncbi:hypothetical protein ABZY06_04650 [Streptomyces sp. NPDC006540]|uniref:hypothetical protein n=1 Tax=Streptomyces sp. NPDC006540 TaxID=3155353 RepID=UPI0033B747D9